MPQQREMIEWILSVCHFDVRRFDGGSYFLSDPIEVGAVEFLTHSESLADAMAAKG